MMKWNAVAACSFMNGAVEVTRTILSTWSCAAAVSAVLAFHSGCFVGVFLFGAALSTLPLKRAFCGWFQVSGGTQEKGLGCTRVFLASLFGLVWMMVRVFSESRRCSLVIAWLIVLMTLFCYTCLQVVQQAVKYLLVGIVVFPLSKVANMSLAADASSPGLLSGQDSIIQTDREKRFLSLLFLFVQCCGDFKFNPCAFNRALRENQQQFIIQADGFIDTSYNHRSWLHTMGSKPTPNAVTLQVGIQPFGECFILARIADEAGIVLNWSRCQGSNIFNEGVIQSRSTQKHVGNISFRPFQRIGSDGRRTRMVDFLQSLYGAKIKVCKNSHYHSGSAEVGVAEVGVAEVGS